MDASLTIFDKTNIDSNAVDGITIVGGAGTALYVPDSSISTVKILDDNVTTAKIADSAVSTAKIADSNVTTAKILADNVTTAKMANTSFTRDKLYSKSVTSLGSCGNCSLTGSMTTISGQSVNKTTNGKPLIIMFGPTSANSGSGGLRLSQHASGVQAIFELTRDGTPIAAWQYHNNSSGACVLQCSFFYLDPVAAGSYVYTIKGQLGGSGSASIEYYQTQLFEL